MVEVIIYGTVYALVAGRDGWESLHAMLLWVLRAADVSRAMALVDMR
jgi:hypothetical protein